MNEPCPLHGIEFGNLKERIESMETRQETIFSKLDELQKNIMSSITKVLISVVVVIGGAAVSLVVYIATTIHGGKP